MLPRVLALLATLGIAATAATIAFVLSADIVTSPVASDYLPKSDDRPRPVQTPTTITFVGDIMLAREVENAILARGVDWPFAAIRTLWDNSDLVVGNFESTIRDAYRDEGNVLAFDVMPTSSTSLAHAGFTHLSLANNHGDDFGAAVTTATRDHLAALGIAPFGDPIASELFIARAQPRDIPLSFIGFHAFLESPDTIAAAVREENSAGRFVIVYPHWGNEYQPTPSQAQIDAAERFVAAGADLIVGAHPHVIEPIETLNGIPVAWSLGNFIFDQDWSSATQEGLAITVSVSDETVTLVPTPIRITNRQASIMTGTRVQAILDFIGAPLGSLTVPR